MSYLEITLWMAILIFPLQQIVVSIVFFSAPNDLDELIAYRERLAPWFSALRYVASAALVMAVVVADCYLAQMGTAGGVVVLVLVSIIALSVLWFFDRLMEGFERSRVESILVKELQKVRRTRKREKPIL